MSTTATSTEVERFVYRFEPVVWLFWADDYYIDLADEHHVSVIEGSVQTGVGIIPARWERGIGTMIKYPGGPDAYRAAMKGIA